MKKIVLALGGNALGGTLAEQRVAIRTTARAIADLLGDGHRVVITHGNGPQVGMIYNAMSALEGGQGALPLPVCTAMSQGYIGYDLQNALREELGGRGICRPVCTLLTQVIVDGGDPAFEMPSKPIGPVLTREQADAAAASGRSVMEDAGRGWRQAAASPAPRAIAEMDTIRTLLDAGQVVIACGGGGIPVVREGSRFADAEAVVDKDFASALLARELGADLLIILTAVERVAIRFGTPEEKGVSRMTAAEAEGYIQAGEFAPGSMLPKVRAAVDFVTSAPGRTALITLLEKARAAVRGETGTVLVP